VPLCRPSGSETRERSSLLERLARIEPILALSARGEGWAPDHPAAADLDLLRSQPPGVVAVSRTPGMRMWIVFGSCPAPVRRAVSRLLVGPLPPGVTRVRLH
jgi:hypothetical protein